VTRSSPQLPWTRRAAGVTACITCGVLGTAHAHTRVAHAPPGKVRHVAIVGDFEAMSPVRKFGEELERAAKDGDALVVLEMNGDRGRADVALALADLVRASSVPVAAYLSDARDRRVGAAQCCVGVSARYMLIDHATSVHALPGDALRDLAPDKPDWERIGRELSGAAYARLRESGAAVDLARLLCAAAVEDAPPDAWAVVPADPLGEARIVFEDPGAAGGTVWRLVGRAASGAAHLTITADRLKQLRAVTAYAGAPGGVAGVLGIKGPARSRVSIDMTLSAARADVESGIAEADELLRKAADDLSLPKPPRQDISDDLYRKASSAARERIASARERLDRSERVVAEYPELTRTAAPGRTEVAGKPSTHGAGWRITFQKRIDLARTLEEKAAAFDPAGWK